MLILKGKVVTIHDFVSSKTGKRYLRVGVAGGGEYNQVNGEEHLFEGVGMDAEVEFYVNIANNGQLWLKRS